MILSNTLFISFGDNILIPYSWIIEVASQMFGVSTQKENSYQ